MVYNISLVLDWWLENVCRYYYEEVDNSRLGEHTSEKLLRDLFDCRCVMREVKSNSKRKKQIPGTPT